MRPPSTEQARFLRPSHLPGVEALHATFVSHRYPSHLHDTWTLARVTAGAASFDLEGRAYVAPAGTSFFIPPGGVHTGESASPGGYTYRVLYLGQEQLAPTFNAANRASSYRLPVVLDDTGLGAALDHVHATLCQPGMMLEQGEAVAAAARRILEVIGREPVRDRRAHPAVRAARTYIQERWREDFTLENLASEVGLSAFHVAHQFPEQIGMPPSTYRRALRVQAAQRLLRKGVPPVVAALECGFCDQAHLNRHFKRITGVTPGQYASAA
jgi:AraC-like DNA-binding protein